MVEILETKAILEKEVSERRHTNDQLLKNQKELRRLAQALTQAEESERQRIATGLHDHLGQSLAAAKVKLGLLGTELNPEQQEAVQEIRTLLNDTIRFARSLTFELGSPLLYEFGLGAALEQLAESESDALALPIGYFSTGNAPSDFSDKLGVLLFRGCRELVHNVSKHAHASRADIRLSWSPQKVVVSVEDNGRGFQPDSAGSTPQGGFGLFNLRERLEHNGGHLRIDSRPGAGCSVQMEIPMSRQERSS